MATSPGHLIGGSESGGSKGASDCFLGDGAIALYTLSYQLRTSPRGRSHVLGCWMIGWTCVARGSPVVGGV